MSLKYDVHNINVDKSTNIVYGRYIQLWTVVS